MFQKPLLIALILWLPSLAFAGQPTIMVLGDSISAAYGINSAEGWVQLLQQRLQKQGYPHQVINASVSGDTTRTGLNRLPDAVRQHQPDIVIVALGGNDGLRGLSFKEIRSSLAQIIEYCQQRGIDVVLAGIRLPPNYGAFYNKRFAELFQELARQYDTALVPQLLADVSDHAELMQPDGMHPVARAQPRILENVWPHLSNLLRQDNGKISLLFGDVL